MALFVRREDTNPVMNLYNMGQHETKLVIGLGNTGKEFDGTRHNIGFEVLDALATDARAKWKAKPAMRSNIAEIRIGGTKLILVKPITMMNLSGEALFSVQKFYKITNQHTVAVYDDVDLPFGTVRTRLGGSDGGHNGVKSLISHSGENFARIRIGVANELLRKTDTAAFVLAQFSKDEQQQTPQLIETAQKYINDFVSGEFLGHTSSV